MRRAFLALLVVLVGGCGAGFGEGTPSQEDAGNSGSNDAGACAPSLSWDPLSPHPGDQVTVTVFLPRATFEPPRLLVTTPTGEVEEPLAIGAGERWEFAFVVALAGSYDLLVDGDGLCPAHETMTIEAAGSSVVEVRLRFTPTADQQRDVPPQEASVVVSGGIAERWLPDQTLLAGMPVAGRLVGSSGAPLAGYARLRAIDGGSGNGAIVATMLVGDDGLFAARVAGGIYDLLVVPEGDVAPKLLGGLTIDSGATDLVGDVVLDAGELVTGVVVNADGSPLVGGRVVLAPAGGSLPASLAVTAADGSFAVHVRDAALGLTLAVLPKEGSPLHPFSFAARELAPADFFSVVLPDLATETVAGRVTGEASAGARVTFVATAMVGVLSVNGVDVPLSPGARVAVIADEDGAVPEIELPLGTYDVVVETAEGGAGAPAWPAVTALDLGTGLPPALLELDAVAPISAHLRVGAGGTVVADARVVAIAMGVHGIGAGATVEGTTAADGTVDLPLAPGQSYALRIEPPSGRRLARRWMSLVAGADSPVEVELQAAQLLSGKVRFGAPLAGVLVEAFCGSCDSAADPAVPLAVGVSAADGRFSLALPDPPDPS